MGGNMSVSKKQLSIFIIIVLIALALGYVEYKDYQAKQVALHYQNAGQLYKEGKYEEAMREYEAVFNSAPESKMAPECLFKAGYIADIFLRKADKAQALLEKYLEKYPGQKEYLDQTQKYLLQIYTDTRQRDKLAKIADQYVERAGNKLDDVSRLQLTQVYTGLGDVEKAYQQIQDVADKDNPAYKYDITVQEVNVFKNPMDPEAHRRLALAYQHNGFRDKAQTEYESINWLKKHEEAVKAAQQKKLAPSNYPIGITEKKVAPKIALTQREEDLYINYNLALNKFWPQDMNKLSQSMGTPKDEQESRSLGEKIGKYHDAWWSAWYTKNKTSYNECEKISAKVANDRGLERALTEKINQREKIK
jgi:hypothetical protein